MRTSTVASSSSRLPLNDIEVCSDLIDEHRDDLAAVLLDPLPAALGLIPPSPEFVSALQAKTRECGALLIADEVLSFRIDYRGGVLVNRHIDAPNPRRVDEGQGPFAGAPHRGGHCREL